jgi:hypothetical protein
MPPRDLVLDQPRDLVAQGDGQLAGRPRIAAWRGGLGHLTLLVLLYG